jgi:pseudouridine-5'-phosphate glycosidase
MHPLLRIHPEVQLALDQDRPVVALESTLIAHGMPWPRNLETAQLLEQRIREQGAVPATVAVMEGSLCVGLDPDALELLARSGPKALKLSRRDMPFALADQRIGATTVAGTLMAAHMAGIAVFATGGIGGVHRGWQHSLDISADLPELARSPVAVVCAGAKSILDLPATREQLETYGIPVCGYQTDAFPAFYTRDSGLGVDARVESPAQWAKAFRAQRRLSAISAAHGGLQARHTGGMLVVQPVPEAYEAEAERIEKATQQALKESEAKGLSGKGLTPFLLQRIAELTDGASLESNVRLVENNAILAAQLATALSTLEGWE